MTAALREHRAGDTVAIVVQRGDTAVNLRAVLGRRGS
jgi:hypothetical protein